MSTEGTESSPSENTTSDMDFLSNLSLPHLDFILDVFIPASGTDPMKRQHETKTNLDDANPEMGQQPENPISAISSGSVAEGLNLPGAMPRDSKHLQNPSNFINPDLDVLYISESKCFAMKEDVIAGRDNDSATVGGMAVAGIVDTSKSMPGYLRIKPFRKDKSAYATSEEGEVYVSTDAIKEDLLQGFLIKTAGSGIDSEMHGPSLQLKMLKTLPGLTDLQVITDVDSVVAFPCPKWPRIADDFINRPRENGWPASGLLKNIISDGCLIVPSAHPSSKRPDLEWRFSFSKAEKRLVGSLTAVQVQCYLLMKLMCSEVLDLPKILKSYHLKTTFFWACEKLHKDHWTSKNLAKCLLFLIDELLHYLIKGHLPNYFIPSSNLIGHIPEEFVRDITQKVSKMRKDPLQSLLTFDDHYVMPHWPFALKMKNILAPVINGACTSCAPNAVMEQILFSGTQLAMVLLKEPFMGTLLVSPSEHIRQFKFQHATTALQITEKYLPTSHRGLKLYASIAKACGETVYAAYMEYLFETFVNDPTIGSHHGNLACYYHNQLASATDPNERISLREKVETHFQHAIRSENCSSATIVDYAIFLISDGRIDEATDRLNKVIVEGDLNHWNGYDAGEIHILDPTLQREVETNSSIAVPSVVMAFHLLLTSCYVGIRLDVDKRNSALCKFDTACLRAQELFVGTQRRNDVALCFFLLGTGYENAENYEAALQTYSRALEIRPDYGSASERKDLVDAILLSLNMST